MRPCSYSTKQRLRRLLSACCLDSVKFLLLGAAVALYALVLTLGAIRASSMSFNGRKPPGKLTDDKPVERKYFRSVSGINPHPFNWILLEKDLCHQKDPSIPLVLIIVHTGPKHTAFREAIRATWGNNRLNDYDLDAKVETRILFTMGSEDDAKVMDNVKKESDQYHDIVQENFTDNYKNLTYKAVMWMKWTSEYCPQAFQVVKIDDDIFVNRFALLRLIRKFHDNGLAMNRTITCKVWINMPVIRDVKSKWYVGKTEFQEDSYPIYCSGGAYMFSGDLSKVFYEASLDTKFFWVDDVYVTGMLREKVGDVTYQDVAPYMYLITDTDVDKVENHTERVLFMHSFGRSERHYHWWNNFTDGLGLPTVAPTTMSTKRVPKIIKLQK